MATAPRILIGVGDKVPYRLQRIGPVGGHSPNATLGHAAGEAGTERSRDDNIDAIQRMCAFPMKRVHGHVLRHIQAIDLHRLASRVGPID
jgi:hypothetical protein